MSANTFGTYFQLSSFGESHGLAIGGVINGCPAGLDLDFEFIQNELDRRKPGQSKITTQRKESDTVQIVSGVFENKTLGTPIGFMIQNEDQKSKDYEEIKDSYRPSHADFTWEEKFGIRDFRGGGRSSARETASRVVAGALAKILLKQSNDVSIQAFVSSVGDIELKENYKNLNLELTETNIVRCPDENTAEKMIGLIEETRKNGDTVGGTITCVIKNVPVGWGEPVFDKLQANLAKAMLSINAVKGFEYGSGFEGTKLKGSEHNDRMTSTDSEIKFKSNYAGGILGGISNGDDIYFKLAFKPVATIMQTQESVNNKGENIAIKGKGRHDPCVLPRAVVIVEAMAAMVLADAFLASKLSRI